MTIPLSWLQDYVTINEPVEKLAGALTFAGTKVEAIRKRGTETLLEFEITSNRPDTLAVIGIAREVAALYRTKLRMRHPPQIHKITRAPFSFRVQDKTLCSRYSAVLLHDVAVKTSPAFIQQRLGDAGFKPVNNIVDITNYVMLEMGIPLHAFDMDKIHGSMTMRASRQGERITTLNGKTNVLPENAIVIADERTLIDLAGLQGGKNSAIEAGTRRVLLLAPIYNPTRIRRTSKFLGLRTEASVRFEKKLDRQAPPIALARALDLMNEYAGASIVGGISDRSYENVSPPTISYPLETSTKILGIDVTAETATRILTDLGCTVRLRGGALLITPPSFRRDLTIPVDIAEELGRILGYNTFPKTIPTGPIPIPPELFVEDRVHALRDHLVRLGFTEHIGSTLHSEEALKKTGLKTDAAIPVTNPMAKDYARLRPTLMISLLEAVKRNQRFSEEISLFEIGHIFHPPHDHRALREEEHLGIISTRHTLRVFLGIIEDILGSIQTPPRPEEIAAMKKHAWWGLSPTIRRNWQIAGEVFAAEFRVSELLAQKGKPRYKKISPYPAACEDLSFFLAEETPLGEVWRELRSNSGRNVRSIDLIDIFTGKNAPKGKKSVTIRITFQSLTHTLIQREISEIREKMVRILEKKFAAAIRRAKL